MSHLQLDPPIEMDTPHGRAFAHMLIDYGMHHNLVWVCFSRETGECWCELNPDVRLARDATHRVRPADDAHTPVDSIAEGWILRETEGGVSMIQRYDGDPAQRFKTDAEALSFVIQRAMDGSPLHVKALRQHSRPASDKGHARTSLIEGWYEPNEAWLQSKLYEALQKIINLTSRVTVPHTSPEMDDWRHWAFAVRDELRLLHSSPAQSPPDTTGS